MKNIRAFLYLSIFFFKESGSFMAGTNRLRYYAYYPIAYFKFIYYSFKTKQ